MMFVHSIENCVFVGVQARNERRVLKPSLISLSFYVIQSRCLQCKLLTP